MGRVMIPWQACALAYLAVGAAMVEVDKKRDPETRTTVAGYVVSILFWLPILIWLALKRD